LAHVVASLRLFELTGDPSEFPPYIASRRGCVELEAREQRQQRL